MASKTRKLVVLHASSIIVPRLVVVPVHPGAPGVGSALALCAPTPPPRYTPSAPTPRAPSTHMDGSRAAIFSAIGESLLGEDFAEQTDWIV